ncbi:MAG: family 10 glycosylhydrolase [Clostridia bacterium]|nr:family 10 glycosylhydrolase [Clostridia bacterium]
MFSKTAFSLSRRPAALLLAFLILFSALPAVFFRAFADTVTITASGVDMARGTGQLIIYTPAYGATTATNEWGAEACVDANNKVISVCGNSSKIPDGGFVLSGHDPELNSGMKTWILTHVKVGQYVYYNPVSLEVTVTDKPLEDRDDVFYTVRHALTGVNGTRSENALMVYTPSKGKKTGTNEYGCEVPVSGGLVVSVGGNDSTIPSDGFVVSGHGEAGEWLRKQVKIGMSCTYDASAKTVTFTLDDQSLLAGLKRSLEDAASEMEAAKESYLYMDYDAFEASRKETAAAFEKAEADYKKSKSKTDLVAACDELRDRINLLRNSICESVTVQYRAAWLRPVQSNAAEVDQFVEELYRNGINTVCVEGLFNSTVIMNVPEDSLFAHNPSFSYDVLQAYIDACRKRNMECHLWMAICHVSNISGTNYAKSLARKKPEWLAKNNAGTLANENNFLMIDPANEEAREYLISFYEYIVRTYDIDGFELDYIRYCDNGEYDFGYTDAAFKGFREEYGTDVTPKYDTKADYWNDWVQYRCDCISRFVRDISARLKKVKPGIVIAADVVPNPTVGKSRNYQDYMGWVKEGWIDLLHPMAYGDGFDSSISTQVREGGMLCAVAVGLGVFDDSLGAQDMVAQAIRDNRLAALGDVYFEATTYLKDKAGEALLATVYRNPALTPFRDRDAALKEALSYLKAHAETVIHPLGGMTDEEFASLSSAVDAASASVSGGRIRGEDLKNLNTVIRTLEDKKAYAALNRDLTRAAMITSVIRKCGWPELFSDEPEPDPAESSVAEPAESSESEVSEPEESAPEAVSETSPESSAVSNPEESQPIPFWIWILIGGFVLAIAVSLILLLRGKKESKG